MPRTSQVDELVLSAFHQTAPPVTLLAVGGYGRQELFPYSDVDLLLLVDALPTASQREPISAFLRILWDSGLRVSQSVHTTAECCEIHDGNLELTISLLDRRFLSGDPSRHAALERLFPKFVTAERTAIIQHLGRMTRSRHAKFADTIYHLEPNVKEHPGGLRDLHVIHWLHALKPFEFEPLDQPGAFIFDVRTRLHEHFRRDNNLLSFDAQDAIGGDAAMWMREYYRNARRIHRALQRALDLCESPGAGLLAQFRDWRSRLSNTEFTVARDRVLLRQPAQLESDPAVVLRLMLFIARHQVPLARDTESRLCKVRALPCSWMELKEILALPRCVIALRAMADLGLLQLIIPEWARIDCLVVRDFYHRYTVDEHTLVTFQALDRLADLDVKEAASRRFQTLFQEIDQPAVLRMALLFHDIGKGDGADHAERSAVIARSAMTRFHVPQAEQDTVLFLIERHLDLYSVMTSRDLSDPSTARQIAQRTGTIERLKLLAVLTYADISAVNPTAMTPWRLEQLWQAYLSGMGEFTRELETERIHLPAEASPESAAFLEGLPTRYLKTHAAAEVAAHVELASHSSAVHFERLAGLYRITVVAEDRPFLLASISGVLASFGLNILKAEAFANARGQAIDTFVFADDLRTLDLNPDEVDRLRDTVLRAVQGKLEIAKLMQKRRRSEAKPRIQPTVSFANDVSETCTLIEIVAQDRPALLYDLAQTISSAGANIEVVLIDTEAHRALDVFYVRSGGAKLPEDRMAILKEKLLEACR